MQKFGNQSKAAHAKRGLNLKSPYIKVLSVVMAILLVFLLVPSNAMSTVRSWADEAFPPAEEPEGTTEETTDPSADLPEVTEEVNQEAPAAEAQAEQSGHPTKHISYIYNADGSVQVIDGDYFPNGDGNATVDFGFVGDYEEGASVFTSATAPTYYYKDAMDLDFRGYVASSDKDATSFIHVKSGEDDPWVTGFHTVYSSQNGMNGNYIQFIPNTIIKTLTIKATPRMVDLVNNLFPHLYLSTIEPSSVTSNVLWQSTDEQMKDPDTTYTFTINLPQGKYLEPGGKYFLFSNVWGDDSSSSTNTAYGAVYYNDIQAEYENTSFVANIKPTTTVVDATATVTNGTETYSKTVTTSTFNDVRLVIPNIPDNFVATTVEITALNYTTKEFEAPHTFTACWNVGDVYLNMDSLKITGKIKQNTQAGNDNTVTLVFAYYDTNRNVITNKEEYEHNLRTSDYNFEFSSLVGGQEGLFAVLYDGLVGFAGYVPARTSSLSMTYDIDMPAGNTAAFTYDTNSIAVTSVFNYLDDTSKSKTFDVPSGFNVPAGNIGEYALPLTVSTFGQYDVVKNTWKNAGGTTKVETVPQGSPYILDASCVEANFALASPTYSWMVNRGGQVTELEDGDTYNFQDGDVVTCTGSAVSYETGQRIEITETRVASGKITQTATTDVLGNWEWTSTFTKAGFSTQTINIKYESSGTHTHDGVTFNAWSYNDRVPSSSGAYYLTQDITIGSQQDLPVSIARTTTIRICLNGHQINLNGKSGLYSLSASSSNLYIYDDHAGESSFRHYFNPVSGTNLWEPSTSTTNNYIDGGVITGSSGANTLISVGSGNLYVYGGAFVGNYRTDSGSVVNAGGGTVTIDGSHERGGSVEISPHSSVKSVHAVNVIGNNQDGTASGGGGTFYFNGTTVKITGCSYIQNRTVGNLTNRDNGSGAVYFTSVSATQGNTVFTNVNFYENYGPGKGGAMFVQGNGSGSKYVDFKNVNMQYNACGSYNGTVASSAVSQAWGGGIALSTNSWMTHLRFDGYINITENSNCCYTRGAGETKVASADNVSLERKGGSSGSQSHSLIYFQNGFDMSNSKIGVNTFEWSANNSAFIGRVTDGAENYEKLISVFQEDTVLDATHTGESYTIATRQTEVGGSSDRFKGELFLLPHDHTLQYTGINIPNDRRPSPKLYNTLQVSCNEAEDGFEYHMERTATLYDQELSYQDYYKCKYQESPLQMTAKGNREMYDGNEHPIELVNFSEMYQQELIKDPTYTYYVCEEDGQLGTKLDGPPVKAGQYCCVVSVPLANGATITVDGETSDTATLTSFPYEVTPREVTAYIIGKNRTFNGSGKLTQMASSYLYNEAYSSATVIPGDDVYVSADDDAYSILSTYGTTATPYNYNEYVTYMGDRTKNLDPISLKKDAASNVGYELAGDDAANYVITAYDGHQHITPFTHNPKYYNASMSKNAAKTINYNCTYNWFDGATPRGDGGRWFYDLYIGHQTSQTVISTPLTKLTYKYLTLNEDKTKVISVHDTDQYLDTELKYDYEGEGTGDYRYQGGVILSHNDVGTTYLQTTWAPLDINNDGYAEYEGGTSPKYDPDLQEYVGGWIEVTVGDSNMPGLITELEVVDENGKDINETEVQVGDTVYYNYKVTNNGLAKTKDGITLESELFDGGKKTIDDLDVNESYTNDEPIPFTVTGDLIGQKFFRHIQAFSSWESTGTTLTITSNKPEVWNQVIYGVVNASVQSFFYDGTQKTATSAMSSDGVKSITGTYQATDVVRNADGSVGTYACTVTLNDFWQWNDGTSAPKTFNWSIYPRDITITPQSFTGLYDRTIHSLSNIDSITETTQGLGDVPKVTLSGGQGTGTITLSTGDQVTASAWSANNARENQGTTTPVTITSFTVSNDKAKNYNLASGNGAITINTRTINATITGAKLIGDDAITYDGKEHTIVGVSVTVESGFELYYNQDGEVFKRAEVLVAKGTDVKENYKTDFYFEDLTAQQFNYDDTLVHPQDKSYVNVVVNYTKVNGALEIDPQGLDDDDLISATGANFIYNDIEYEQTASTLTVKFTPEGGSEVTLTAGTDFTIGTNKQVEANEGGTAYTTTITGIGNFSNSVDVEWYILKRALTISWSDPLVEGVPTLTVEYDNASHSLTPKYEGLVDRSAASGPKHSIAVSGYDIRHISGDATITTNSQTDAGENGVKVSANGYTINSTSGGAAIDINNYKPTIIEGIINITPISIADESKWTATNATTGYNGAEQDAFTIKHLSADDPDQAATLVGQVGSEESFNVLVHGEDFDVDTTTEGMSSNLQTKAGTYTIKVDGKHNFTGSRTLTYEIRQARLAVWGQLTILKSNITGNECTLPYTDTTSDYGGMRIMTFVKNNTTGAYDTRQQSLLGIGQSISGTFTTKEAIVAEDHSVTPGDNKIDAGYYPDTDRYYYFMYVHDPVVPCAGTLDKTWSVKSNSGSVDETANYNFVDYGCMWDFPTPGEVQGGVAVRIAESNEATINLHFTQKTQVYNGTKITSTIENNEVAPIGSYGDKEWYADLSGVDSTIREHISIKCINKMEASQVRVGTKTVRPTVGSVDYVAPDAGQPYVKQIGDFEVTIEAGYTTQLTNGTVTVSNGMGEALTCTVTPAPLTVAPVAEDGSSSISHVYDGLAHNFSDVEATGLVQYGGDDHSISDLTFLNNRGIDVKDSTSNVTVDTLKVTGKDDESPSEDADLTSCYTLVKNTGSIEITPFDIPGTDPDKFVINTNDYVYNGANRTELYSVTGHIAKGDVTMAEGTDFTFNTAASDSLTQVNVKEGYEPGRENFGYKISITGIGNYQGTMTAYWNITPRPVTLKTADVTVDYDGNKHFVQTMLSDVTTPPGPDVGLVSGHTALATGFTPDAQHTDEKFKDGIIDVADSPATYTANGIRVNLGAINSRNYDPTFQGGKVTITPVKINTEAFTLAAKGFIYRGVETELESTLNDPDHGGTLALVWTHDGKTTNLTLNTDFEVDETDGSDYKARDVSETNYTIRVKGMGNFSDAADSVKTADWNVIPAVAYITPVSITEGITYDSKEHNLTDVTMQHKWKASDSAFIEGLMNGDTVYKNATEADVTFTYTSGHTDAGTWPVTVKANKVYTSTYGTNYMRNYTWYYNPGTIKIDPYNIQPEQNLGADDYHFTYNGLEQTLTKEIVLNSCKPTAKFNDPLQVPPTWEVPLTAADFSLTTGTDVTYTERNANGDATGLKEKYHYAIKGSGNFTGTRILDWYIDPADVEITATPASGQFQFAGKDASGNPILHKVEGSTVAATSDPQNVFRFVTVTHQKIGSEVWTHGAVTDESLETANGVPTKWSEVPEWTGNIEDYFTYSEDYNDGNVNVTWAEGEGKIVVYPKSLDPDPPVPVPEDDDSGYITVEAGDVVYDSDEHGADSIVVKHHLKLPSGGENVYTLVAGTDYEVSVSDKHTNVGTYFIKVTGKEGSSYRDQSAADDWSIIPIDLVIKASGNTAADVVYDAKPHYADQLAYEIVAAYVHGTQTPKTLTDAQKEKIADATNGDFSFNIISGHETDARAGGTDVKWNDSKTDVVPYVTDMNVDWFNAVAKVNTDGTQNTPGLTKQNGDPWKIKITPKDPGDDPFEVHWSSGYTDGFTYDFVEYQIKDEWLTVTDTTLTSESEPQGHVLSPNDFEIVPYNDSSLEGDEQSWPKAKEAKVLTDEKGVARIAGDDGNLYTIIIRGQQGSNYANIPMKQWVDPEDHTQGMEKLQTEWGIHRRPIDNASSIEGMHNDTYIALKNPVLRYTGEPLTQEIDNVTMNSWHGGQWGPTMFTASNEDDPVREAINENTDYSYPRQSKTEAGVYYLSINGVDNFKNSVDRPYVIIDEKDPGEGDSHLSFGVRVFDDQYAPTEVTNQGVNGWDAIMMTAYVDDLSDMYAVTDPQSGNAGSGWLEIYLDIKDAMSTIADAVRGEFEKAMARDGMELFQYIDVDVNSELYLQRYGETERKLERVREIHELNHDGDTLDITMNVPQAMQDYAVATNNPNAFKIYREHDGVVSDLVYTYDMQAGTVSFTSDKFSNFCIAYNPEAGNNTPQTGDNPWVAYAIAGLVALALVGAFIGIARRRNMNANVISGRHTK